MLFDVIQITKTSEVKNSETTFSLCLISTIKAGIALIFRFSNLLLEVVEPLTL